MGRHGMKFCLLCNPFGNGTRGDEGTEAIGRYYLMRGPNQAGYGWTPVCEDHAERMKRVGYEVESLKGQENHPYWLKQKEEEERERAMTSGPYEHEWRKDNLVGQEDGSDFWKCEKCGVRIRTYMGDRPTQGCTVEG